MPAAEAVTEEPPPSRPLVLVGMPGSGKSTVGRRLARRLGRPFVDADRELEVRCGVSIATMFEIEGEPGFRERESRLLEELLGDPALVIATGGGAVLAATNRDAMRRRGRVVYLQASLAELWTRVRHDRKRPLLQGTDGRARLAALLDARTPLYEEIAELTVRSHRQSAERLCADIIDALRALDPTL